MIVNILTDRQWSGADYQEKHEGLLLKAISTIPRSQLTSANQLTIRVEEGLGWNPASEAMNEIMN
jgi:hypothetical protein